MELTQDQITATLAQAAAKANDGTGPEPAYQYRFDPASLFVGAMAAPTLTITNPSRTDDGPSGQTLYILIPIGPDPDDITVAAGGMTIASPNRNWQISPYLNQAKPYVALKGPALKPLESVSFTFNTLQVSPSKGTAAFVIQESANQANVTKTIAKVATDLDIHSFYASPVTVTNGTKTNLTWVVSGGSYVVLQPGSIRRDIKGTGRFTDSYQIDVGAPSQSYLLQLFTDDRQSTQAVTVAFVGSVSARLESDATAPIGTADEVTLTWESEFADADPVLEAPDKSVTVDRSGTMTVTPGSALTGNVSSVVYTLTAKGHGGPATDTATITFEPVRIRWFRYSDMTKKTVEPPSVANPAPGWPKTDLQTDNNVLTTYGPGAGTGPLKAYLGTGPELQVQVITAAPDSPAPGQNVVLSYATGNAVSASLSIGLGQPSKPVDLDTAKQTGTTTIKAPDASTTLVLTVTGNGCPDVTSEFDLTVQPGTS
ncbi:hypothetical protein [Roseovarius sp. M141]|uniref:hypothetical protein n=1 Tax=Roseovarius sp. M141 TaxID=2583806 RepID=UPI0020CBBFF1|nr:hypothetical protein [Roseovarius sp. M141]MCQ0090819.1 hypothetical protein [Roseovarius sp. M141]